jgi:hypothetical protein
MTLKILLNDIDRKYPHIDFVITRVAAVMVLGLFSLSFTQGSKQIVYGAGKPLNLNDVSLVANGQQELAVSTAGINPQLRLSQEPHFSFAKNTGDSYSIVIDDVRLDHLLLQPGDEIGLFTDKGLCVGAVIWPQTLPVGLVAWADNSQTTEYDGFRSTDLIVFHIWDVAAQKEYPVIANYSMGDGYFGSGIYSRLQMLDGYSDFQPPQVVLQQPEDNSVNNPIDCVTVVQIVDQGCGIDRSSLLMFINDDPVSPQVDGDSAKYDLAYTPTKPFGYNKTLVVRVECEDMRHNRMSDYIFSFATVADVIPPSITAHVPMPNVVDAPGNTSIAVHIVDETSGVQQNSIVMQINGEMVNPVITGTSNDYSLSYAPSVDFSFTEVVTVTLAAADQAGNVMGPESYHFTIMPNPNIAPAAPELISPQNDALVNEQHPSLIWNMPYDQNGALLHFKIEIAKDAQFQKPIDGSPFESRTIPVSFSPTPPIISGNGAYCFTVPIPLTYGCYWWRATAMDNQVAGPASMVWSFNFGPTTGVEQTEMGPPKEYELYQNYPNPFNPSTTISFAMRQSGPVFLQIIDINGRLLKDLFQGEKPAGRHTVCWHADDNDGHRVASGLYFCRMVAAAHVFYQKLIVTK